MYDEVIIRLVLMTIGVVILVATIFSLARRRMTETLCLVWGVLAVMFVCAGIFLEPVMWSVYISPTGSVIVLIAVICVLWCAFFMTMQLSILSRKNQELAMQVSLLNQENETMLERVQALEKGGKE